MCMCACVCVFGNRKQVAQYAFRKWIFLLNSQNGSHIDPQPYSFFSHQRGAPEGLALGIKILKLTASGFSPSL